MKGNTFDPDSAGKFYELLGHKSETELRPIDPNKKTTINPTFLYSKATFVQTCEENNGKKNVYAGLNERTPGGTKKENVITLNCAVIDIDAIRRRMLQDKGITDAELEGGKTAASDEELAKVLAKLKEVVDYLTAIGCEIGGTLMSGNGAQILIPFSPAIELTEANRFTIETNLKEFGRHLGEKFNDEDATIDPTVFELARIAKVPGTLSIKGKNLKHRPWRLAQWLNYYGPQHNDKLRARLLQLTKARSSTTEAPLVVPVHIAREIDGMIKDRTILTNPNHKIPAGERHYSFMKLWGRLSSQAYSREQIAQAIQYLNQTKTEQPKSSKDVAMEIQDILYPTQNEVVNEEQYAEAAQRLEKDVSKVSQRKTQQLSSVEHISAALHGKRVSVRGRIVSQNARKALPSKLETYCPSCRQIGGEKSLTLKDALSLKKSDLKGAKCSECSDEDNVVCTVRRPIEYRDYCELAIMDALEDQDKTFSLRTAQPLCIYAWSEKIDALKIIARGEVGIEPALSMKKTHNLCIYADDVEPQGDDFLTYIPTPEDERNFEIHFRDSKELPLTQVCPDMVGRPLAQEGALLTIHSPNKIPSVNGPWIRGVIHLLYFGDSKTNKSTIGEDLTYGHYHLGDLVEGEQSGRTGLTYTIDMDSHSIIWGALPLNDGGFCFIDGAQNFHIDEWGQLREVLEKGRVAPRKAISGEANCNLRLITAFNPGQKGVKPMCQYYHKCIAITDSWIFQNAPDLTRWDIAIAFAQDDVAPERITQRGIVARPIPDDIFIKHIKWVWSLTPEQIIYDDAAKEDIKTKSTALLNEFTSPSIPIVHNGARDILSRVAAAYACLKHSVEAGKVIIKSEHVALADDFLRRVYEHLQLSEYRAAAGESDNEVDENVLDQFVGKLEANDWILLKAVSLKPKTSPELAELLSESDRTVRTRYGRLKVQGLLKTAEGKYGGVELTIKGVSLLKILASDLTGNSAKNCTVKKEQSGKTDLTVQKPAQLSDFDNLTVQENSQLPVRLSDHISLKVRILKPLPAYLGSDGRTYGPYVEGQEAELPAAEAHVIIRCGAAEVLDVA
ncbi:MAG: hypothetical protein V1909_02615 [Candidatus Micrarchaeota archaeon]